MRGISLVLAFFFSITTWAVTLVPFRFGPEFNISKSETSTSMEHLTKHLLEHLVINQPEGSKFQFNQVNPFGLYRPTFFSPNGWWFSYYPDGGIEFTMKPMTVDEYKRFKDDIQDAIFVSAANQGYFPQLWRGGGHINVDITNFRNNPVYMRNFIVDLWNHNELFMGIFNYDTHNAIPHHFSTNLAEKVAHVDEMIRSGQGSDFDAILVALRTNLSGNAFNLYRDSTNRIEIRAVRPQTSMDVWIRQISLLEARLKYLATIDELIPYQPRVPWDYDSSRNELEPPVDPQQALRSFYSYVDESKQDWVDHRDYIWPQWTWRQEGQEVSELEKFEASSWFKVRQARRECEKSLEIASDERSG